MALLMENCPELLEVEAAAERSLHCTCINTHLTAEDAANIVNDGRARVVVASPGLDTVATALRVTDATPVRNGPKRVFLTNGTCAA